MSKFVVFYLEVLLLVILPIFLFTGSSTYFVYRPLFMALGGIYCSVRLWRSEATMASLGIHIQKFRSATKDLILPSVLLVFTTLVIFYLAPESILKMLVGYDPLSVKTLTERLLAYIFVSVPIQEIIFRGYVTWRIREVYSSVKVMEFISVAIFTFIHIPFHSPLLLLLTLAMGIIYIRNYQKYQNLFAPIISHAFVGACLVIIRNAWFPYT